MSRAHLTAYAALCAHRAKPITARSPAVLVVDRIAAHLGITRDEARELPLLHAVAAWRDVRQFDEPGMPKCAWCGEYLDVGDGDATLDVNGWGCGPCNCKHDSEEAERNRGELDVEDHHGC